MTIGITGPEQKAPGRRNVLAGLIVVGIVGAVFLILLGLFRACRVDALWFCACGFSRVFWPPTAARASVFFAVFAITFVIVWATARLAFDWSRRGFRPPAAFDWKLAANATSSDLFGLIRSRL